VSGREDKGKLVRSFFQGCFALNRPFRGLCGQWIAEHDDSVEPGTSDRSPGTPRPARFNAARAVQRPRQGASSSTRREAVRANRLVRPTSRPESPPRARSTAALAAWRLHPVPCEPGQATRRSSVCRRRGSAWRSIRPKGGRVRPAHEEDRRAIGANGLSRWGNPRQVPDMPQGRKRGLWWGRSGVGWWKAFLTSPRCRGFDWPSGHPAGFQGNLARRRWPLPLPGPPSAAPLWTSGHYTTRGLPSG